MKKRLPALMILLISSVAGNIWYVDSTPGRNPDFAQVTEAIASASVLMGDTLYVAGSNVIYELALIPKRVVLIGPGYFLDENATLQGNNIPASIRGPVFQPGSAGSIMTGFRMISGIDIQDDSVTVTRNYISAGNWYAIRMSIASNNIAITQNYILSSGINKPTIDIPTTAGSIIISNNFIHNDYVTAPIALQVNNSFVTNNVISGMVNTTSSVFENNIMFSGDLTDNGSNQFLNNLGDATQFGTDNGNQINVDPATVFVGTGTTDGIWQLAAGSPAAGVGVGGIDAGMYGGPGSYVISGLPSIPVIEFLSVPTTGSQSSGLMIQLRARGQN